MRMDESAVLSGPFLFISYSHRDTEAVCEDVDQLIDRGVRAWIDHRSEEEENLALGDNWFQKVQTAINHPNCCGVVFYVSKYSLASRAIHKEQRLVREKARNESFPYYCVSIGGLKMAKHFAAASMLCSDEESAWYNEEYMEGDDDIYAMQRSMFNDNKIFIPRQSGEACVDQIFEKIAVPLGAVDNEGALISSLAASNIASRDTGEIVFGIYKGEKSEPVARSVENARFTLGGCHYIHHNGEFYRGRPLKWRLLHIQDAVAVLICTEIVEKCPGIKVPAFLESFRTLAFTPAESAMVRKIRLFNAVDEEQLDPQEREAILVLDESQKQMYWWIDRDGIIPGWQQTYKNNKPAINGFLITRPKGVRPVIEIAAAELKKIKGE